MKNISQNQQKVKKWLAQWLTFVVGVMIIAMLWSAYSLINFDGFFPPTYAIGLSDPYRYHQKYVSNLLVQHGKEYQLNNADTAKWKVYIDNKNGFKFKYPETTDVNVVNKNEAFDSIRFANNSSKGGYECVISVEFVGRGIGAKWLPRERRSTNLNVTNNRSEGLYYIRTMDGDVFNIESTRFIPENKQNIHFTGATLIHQKTGKFVAVKDYGNTCQEDTLKGILATFQFIK
jgi:hypothetical protein